MIYDNFFHVYLHICSVFCFHHWIASVCAITFVHGAGRWYATRNSSHNTKRMRRKLILWLLCIYYVLYLPAFHFQLDYEAVSMPNITGKDEESVFCLFGLPDHIFEETFSLWCIYSFLGQTESGLHNNFILVRSICRLRFL